MIEIQSKKRSVNRRTNLLASEMVDDCIMVPLEKELVLLICFGMVMVLNEVMLRWRSAIGTNVPLSESTSTIQDHHHHQASPPDSPADTFVSA